MIDDGITGWRYFHLICFCGEALEASRGLGKTEKIFGKESDTVEEEGKAGRTRQNEVRHSPADQACDSR